MIIYSVSFFTLLQIVSFYFDKVRCHSADGLDGDDSCLCRRCGHDVLNGDRFVRIFSKNAVSQRNDTILGVPNVLIQLFTNPAGERFEIFTATKADIFKAGKAYVEDTWFPGYAWTIGVCPKCGAHLGWFYEKQDDNIDDHTTNMKESFVGLVLNSLLSETYANTLTIVPKPKNERSF